MNQKSGVDRHYHGKQALRLLYSKYLTVYLEKREEGSFFFYLSSKTKCFFLTLLKENETNNHPSPLNHKMEGQVKLGLWALKRKAVPNGRNSSELPLLSLWHVVGFPHSLDKHHLLYSHRKTSQPPSIASLRILGESAPCGS